VVPAGVVPPPAAQGFFGPAGPPQAWLARPYQQLLRGPNLRWWRPLLSLGVVAAIGLVAFGTLIAIAGLFMVVTGRLESDPAAGTDTFEQWSITPIGLLVNNLMLAAFIPVAMAAVWAGFRWRPRWVASVVGGVRWRWLAVCSGIAVLAMGGLTAVEVVLTGGVEWDPEPSWGWLLLVVLVSTPLQAAGEEYLFRGWMQQAIGAVIPRPLVGALVGGGVSTTLFALAHGQQDLWLFGDRFAFGAVACLVVYRTGGLEGGIALHAVNNLIAFGFTITSGQLAETLTVSQSDPLTLLINTAVLAVAEGLVLLAARKLHVVRLFRPPIPVA
jgi:membrane protease YdiL (CAAX protease family)